MFRNSLFQVYVGAQNLTIALRPASLNATSRNLTYYLDSSNENTVKGAIFVDDKTGLLHMGGSMQIGRYQIVANGHEYLNETECDTQLSFTLLVMPNEVATTTVVTTTAVSTSLTTTFTTAASTATSTMSYHNRVQPQHPPRHQPTCILQYQLFLLLIVGIKTNLRIRQKKLKKKEMH